MFPQQLRFPLLVAIVLLALPSGRVQSQAPAAAPAADDPVAALQAVSAANDDLLKRQEDNIAELKELTDTANQLRIFSKRS